MDLLVAPRCSFIFKLQLLLLNQAIDCVVLLVLQQVWHRLAFLVPVRVDVLHEHRMSLYGLLLLAQTNRSRSLLLDDDAAAGVRAEANAHSSIHNVGPAKTFRILGQAALELGSVAMSQNGFVLRKSVLLSGCDVQYGKLFALEYF